MSNTFEQIEQKIQSWEQIRETVNEWRAAGERIVFTNGCFDLLHFGHLHYLAQARDLGERLIIGLNDANSVRRLKGAHRPINDEATRQTQLAALGFIDAVVSFPQDTPLKLIEVVLPDVLVKGGDYEITNIVGADVVLARGGSVQTLPFVVGYSTTAIEAKIKSV